MFFLLSPGKKILPSRDLLILDEAHLLETEIVKFRGLSISRRRWKRYIPTLDIVDYGYDDIVKWIDFLIDLESKMLDLIGYSSLIESLSLSRKTKFNWINKKTSPHNRKVEAASEIFESDEEIAKKRDIDFFRGSHIIEELAVEAFRDMVKLTETINSILSNPKNWIVSDIKKENYELTRVEFKPLDTSQYWKAVFEKCNKTLMMSATILDSKTFCTSLGLAPEEVKFIQVGSDFPIQNRPIYPMNLVYLNSDSLQQQDIQIKIGRAIDNLMTLHKNHKGLIHTSNYKQVCFIIEYVSQINRRRLLMTGQNMREEVIAEHLNSTEPTVLISPSLYLGLDLKDDLSRFQIITKVPYPDLGNRWINEKRKINAQWYIWQTALRLVQGYGRSIRSNEDWAKTYVLDSAFANFVNRNKNILPDWFTEAIRPFDLLKTPL
jgi:ATP-dependent DNA helicase DinG